MFPEAYPGPRILLVDGHGRKNYDWSPCLSVIDNYRSVGGIYEQVLTDAGYCYDMYDINGAGGYVHIDPIWLDGYDAVVWFTGPYFDDNLLHYKALQALQSYLGAGGRVVLCGDRLVNFLALDTCPPESLCGESFLWDVMCTQYLEEMPSPFDYPYVYAVAEDTVDVFGAPVEIGLDTLLIYRECLYLKDMSFVLSSTGYACTAQPLMRIDNLPVGVAEAHAVVYSEFDQVGQCVLVDFDLSGAVNHERTYCTGDAQYPAPDFDPGVYDGRVELMRVILEDLSGLPSGGGASVEVVAPVSGFKWALGQNVPNPCVGTTEIRYETARSCHVCLTVYNATGQVVRVLEDRQREAGIHEVRWDATNGLGQSVSSGIYFYKLEAGGFTATRKLLLIK
jgi:hypothetical protein